MVRGGRFGCSPVIPPCRRSAQSASAIMNPPDSTMADTKRSRNVCHVCTLRKKACDKALPVCGFCANHQLPCRYDISASRSKHRRAYNPGRHFVALQSRSARSVSPQAEAILQQLPCPPGQKDHTPIQYSGLYILPESVDESLNRLVQHFNELTGLTYDNITDRYFQACHRWLPIVSPDSFYREASRYREERRLPPADFTALFLAMILITLPAYDPALRPPLTSQVFLYMATKFALSQAQTSICTSLRLIQASLLIALREYKSVQPEAAYITMMTCMGLTRVLGIGIASLRTTRDVQSTCGYRLEKIERENTVWAAAMLERYEGFINLISRYK